MRSEDIRPFLHQYVKLVKTDKFVLYGKILEVNDDCLRFETDAAVSLLSLDAIREIAQYKKRP